MDGWVMRAGELLLPLVATIKRELLAGAYLQADETPVAVHRKRQSNPSCGRLVG